MDSAGQGYRRLRNAVPSSDQKWISPYDFDSGELQDLKQRKLAPFYMEVLDLTTAQSLSNPKIISGQPGRAVVIFGFTSGTGFEPGTVDSGNPTGGGVEPSKTSVFVNCRIQVNEHESSFPLKHNRGYRGLFDTLYLSWPAQSGASARLIIYRYDVPQWTSGEAST